MDFGKLLHTAQKNEQGGKKEIKYYSTKFEPPKKEQRTKTLSANIQKFLARKEEEEKRRNGEAKKKMDQLLELRSKDKKACKRVNVMLKRTKSANQSVIQDAVDNDNTAVTLVGPSQPDEDDYGYVSQSASEYYNKMMEKYSKMPDEPKFQLGKKKVSTNLSSTKDRVKAALDREAEEALLPHRRKRKHKDKEGESTNEPEEKEKEEKYDKYEKKEEKPNKPKLKPAPVINFSDLLKIAEKKQFEPIVIEQKEKEEERLLTKRQRREMEQERESRERRELRKQQALSGSAPSTAALAPKTNKIPKLNGESSKSSAEMSRKTGEPSRPSNENRISKTSDLKVPKPNGLNERVPKKQVDERSNIRPQSSKTLDPKAKMQTQKSAPAPVKTEFKKPDRLSAVDKSKISGRDVSKSRPPFVPQGKLPPKDLKPKQFPPNDLRPKQFPSNDLRPKQFPPNDVRPKQFPPRDLKPKQFPPPDVRRGPPGGMKRKPLVSKGRIYDEDEDYDSEMDDFIDDGADGEEDYSKYISEIFGYDKKKYRYVDEDDDNMETSFAAQMREECISTKLGIMEDMEEMKQEEEAKRRKAIMKKRR